MTGMAAIVTHRCAQCRASIDVLFHRATWTVRIPTPPKRATVDHGGGPFRRVRCLMPDLPEASRSMLPDYYRGFLDMRGRAGIPANVTTWAIPQMYLDTPARWATGLAAMVLAVEVDGPPPPGWPVPWISAGAGALMLTSIYAGRFDVRPVIEARWLASPEFHDRVVVEILGWRHATKQAEMKRLMGAMRFVGAFERIGSGPTATRLLTDEQFAEQAPAKYCEMLDYYEERPTDRELADGLYLTYGTFRRRKDTYIAAGNAWPPRCDIDPD